MHTKYSRIRNSFAAPAYGAKLGSLPDCKTLAALLDILLFMLTTVAGGGAYRKSHPTGDPKPQSFVEILVIADSQQIAVVGGTVLRHAKEQYQSASGEITYKDVTNTADRGASI
jgi:hypothetical protein